MISKKLEPFGTTVFAEMTQRAEAAGAINLAQGFPDFEGPPEIVDAAVKALRSGDNQYARSRGHLELVHAIAGSRKAQYDLDLDPLTEVGVFSGATEGIVSSMLGLLTPGDEVILLEPFYDSYPACAALAGATPRFLTLHFPDFALDGDALEALVTDRTRLLVLNTPMNPTGKVFDREELETIAGICKKHDILVLTDEVYEHLVFDGAEHIPMASIPGMFERTLSLSSAGKTFSFTGWKIGWGMGPADMVSAAQSAHQFVTYATATPLQVAVAYALRECVDDYLGDFRAVYTKRRDYLVDVLRGAGFDVAVPKGTYFILAGFSRLFDGDDREVAGQLIDRCGVAAIPPSAFYEKGLDEGRRLLRWAFCKKMETLEAAAERLRGLGS